MERVQFLPLDKFREVLAIPPATLFVRQHEPLRQLLYIERYVRMSGAKSIVVEEGYIDRDFMEEYSVFYSKNLTPPPNYCTRVHFFSVDVARVRAAFRAIRKDANNLGATAYRNRCERFSAKSYIGFSVIKPLPGCPVGRTVLRFLPPKPSNPTFRQFPCARQYKIHLVGIELTVNGLAFQQQDLGVSACATTALWSALQKARDFEDIGNATPAQITTLASQFALPFGRSMPSEGLSLDQMCQAVRAVGLSPNILRADSFEISRDCLYSLTASGMAAVLVLENKAARHWHAVTVVGMDALADKQISNENDTFVDASAGLTALYVHDDRVGPCLRSEITKGAGDGKLHLEIELRPGNSPGSREYWTLSHILVPMHTKIRLSYGVLRGAAVIIKVVLKASQETVFGSAGIPAFHFTTLIRRSSWYLEELLLSIPGTRELVAKLCETITIPRYFAIIRLNDGSRDMIDVLLDTTGTERLVTCLGVVIGRQSKVETFHVAEILAQECGNVPLIALRKN